jgi:hypothetical protein
MPSSGMLCHVAHVRTDISEECITSIIRVTRIGELGIMLVVTSNQSTLWRNKMYSIACQFLLLWWWRWYVPPKSRFLQEPHGVTSQEIAFVIVTAVKTSHSE